MKILLKILIAATLLGAAVSVGALLLNQVPIFDPPGWKTRLFMYFSRNSATTDADSPFPELRPRTYALPAERLFAIARNAVIELDWQIKSVDASRYELELVVTTALLRFQDDVLVRVQTMPGNTSSLHVHSSSRVGRADFGANLGHILRLQRKIQERITAG